MKEPNVYDIVRMISQGDFTSYELSVILQAIKHSCYYIGEE